MPVIFMKPGLFTGYEKSMEIVVTSDMAPSFDREIIHPVLSTVSMIYYMEWVGRKVIVPFLEEEEEGVGVSINIQHRAPAPIGKIVWFTATVADVTSDKVICSVKAEHNQSVVGVGVFVQAILSRERIQFKILEMSR